MDVLLIACLIFINQDYWSKYIMVDRLCGRPFLLSKKIGKKNVKILGRSQ